MATGLVRRKVVGFMRPVATRTRTRIVQVGRRVGSAVAMRARRRKEMFGAVVAAGIVGHLEGSGTDLPGVIDGLGVPGSYGLYALLASEANIGGKWTEAAATGLLSAGIYATMKDKAGGGSTTEGDFDTGEVPFDEADEAQG